MFFAKLFIKNYKDTSSPEVRQKYGLLSGAIGLIFNLILFAIKLSIGSIIGSVAVISDAFNNFSDMGSTLISVIGLKLSNKKPDRDHPFGHGRFEYISAMIVSFIIMLIGFELFKSSFEKILSPVAAEQSSWLLLIILALSVPVKLIMFFVNNGFSKVIKSQALKAAAIDSRNDAIATAVVILSAVIDRLGFLPFRTDGYMGALVSLLIIYAGFSVMKDTIGLLLGSAPDEETVDSIRTYLKETPEIVDIHDLIIHDYGPGRLFASVHAEVRDDADIVRAHEAIDAVEKLIYQKTGCEITVHLDPISTDNERLNLIRDKMNSLIKPGYSFHDLRMTDGIDNLNIIFDLVVPFEASTLEAKEMTSLLKNAITELDSKYSVVIQIDRDFINSK